MEQKKKALGKGLEELFSTEVLDFDTSIRYLTSIKHLREQLEDYKEKRDYYSNLI